jgi:hypothetical protein
MQVIEHWWPGTELNRRRQPFQRSTGLTTPSINNLTRQDGRIIVTIL